jgi:hypothetical protein
VACSLLPADKVQFPVTVPAIPAAPVVNKLPIKPVPTVNDPPTVTSRPKPAPPATINAPVDVEVEVIGPEIVALIPTNLRSSGSKYCAGT